MITKKLIENVVTFLNNYLGVENVSCGYTYYGKDYIVVGLKLWTIGKDGFTADLISSHNKYINNENDFNEFKKEILDNYKKELKLAKEKSYETIK